MKKSSMGYEMVWDCIAKVWNGMEWYDVSDYYLR
jgi:hypothetical protein